MQRRHQLGHQRVVLRLEAEVGAGGAGAVDKQRHAGVERRFRRAGHRWGQAGQLQLGHAVQRQAAPRGDEQPQLRQPRQPAADFAAGGIGELFEVVQHQQHRAAGQRLQQRVGRAACSAGFVLQGAQHGQAHRVRLCAAGQRHKTHEVGQGAVAWRPARLGQRTCHFHRQPRLAGAAGAAQCHQAVFAQQRGQLCAFGLKAHQACEVLRHPQFGGRPRGLGGRCVARGLAWRLRFGMRSKAGALFEHPFVKEARQQFALGRAGIGAQRTGGQAQRAAVGQQHRTGGRARWFEQRAQHGQRLAQAVAAHVGGHAGPDQLDQLLTRVVVLGPQRQPSQQQRGRARRQPGAAWRAAFEFGEHHGTKHLQPPAWRCSGAGQRGYSRVLAHRRRIVSALIVRPLWRLPRVAPARAASPAGRARARAPARAAAIRSARFAPAARRVRSTAPRSQSRCSW
jgi:hypothetical protein